MPVGINLASSWNPDMAVSYGQVLGKEGNARGKQSAILKSIF